MRYKGTNVHCVHIVIVGSGGQNIIACCERITKSAYRLIDTGSVAVGEAIGQRMLWEGSNTWDLILLFGVWDGIGDHDRLVHASSIGGH